MNVMIVVPWDQERGGVPTVVNKLAQYLTEHGHAVTFLHPGESERPVPKTTRAGYAGFELNLRTLHIAGRPWRSRVAFWLTLPRTLIRLRKLLRDQAIDVVSIHYPLQSFVYFAFCRRLWGTRLVTSVHGADLLPGGKRPEWYPPALRWLLHRSDYITAPSKHFLDSVLVDFPALRERSMAIHNGIDIEEFLGVRRGDIPPGEKAAADTSAPSTDSPTEDTILCIAAHNPKKGIDVLLEAMALLRRRGVELRLVLIGDGPLRPELEAYAERLGVADLVRFAGFQGLAEVRRQLQRCRLFVLPSRSEPFGIVILEAMVSGKPVVATTVGGIPEFVTHLENGILVPPDDPQALAAAICELAGDATLRERLGAAGIETVSARFAYQHTGAKFERLFAELGIPTAARHPTAAR